MMPLYAKPFATKQLALLSLTLAGIGIAAPSQAVIPSAQICVPHNRHDQDQVTLIGRLPDAPYGVVVPGRDDLDTIRQCVPDAFVTQSSLGVYIRVGSFSQRSQAAAIARYLRRQNLDAQVVYWP